MFKCISAWVLISVLSATAPMAIAGCWSGQGIPTQDETNNCTARAEAGDAEAMASLGRIFEQGLGVERNIAKAFRFFESAANLGNPAAQFHLGRFYENGTGVGQSAFDAVRWYEKSAESGYTPAKRALADLWFYGNGVVANHQRAMHWFSRLPPPSASETDSEMFYQLGVIFLQGKAVAADWSKALDYLQQAAAADHAAALFYLGEMHQYGQGVDKDIVKARELFRRAADLDYEKALIKLMSTNGHQQSGSAATPHTAAIPAETRPVPEEDKTEQGKAEQETEQQNASASGITLLIFVLIAVALLGLYVWRRLTTSGRNMSETEKEVINQALHAQLSQKPQHPPENLDHGAEATATTSTEDFYSNDHLETAKLELQNNQIDQASWEQAMHQSHGDMTRAELLYLKIRVSQLMKGS